MQVFKKDDLQSIHPGILQDSKKKKTKVNSRSDWNKNNLDSSNDAFPEGERNESLYVEACRLRDAHINVNLAAYTIEAINAAKCKPPLDKDEARQICYNAYYYTEKDELSSLPPWILLEEFEDDKNFHDPIPIVCGLMNRSEFHIMSATAKTGKTLLQLELSRAVSSGGKFMGHFETKKGKVMIIQTEISNGHLRSRVRKIYGKEILDYGKDVAFIDERIKIDTIEGLKKMILLVEKFKPDLLILDPFYTLHNSNEDSASDIAPILSDLRDIALSQDIAILLVHHQGKRSESGQAGHKHRGSSSFGDVPDGSWSFLRTDEKNTANLSFEMRNIESPETLSCLLDSETLRWSVVGKSTSSSKRFQVSDIVAYIKNNEGIASGALVKALSNKFEIAKRSVQDKIAFAITCKYISKERDGSYVKYYSDEFMRLCLGKADGDFNS